MRRIILILLLIVFVIALSGCEKIKAELERRHLGGNTQKQTQKETSPSTPQAQKTSDDMPIADETSSKRKQIVFRIELPTDEKIQIRLIKNPEEVQSDSSYPLASNVTENKSKAEFETQESKDEKNKDKTEKQESNVDEQSVGAIEKHLVQQRRNADQQESSDEQSRSGIKTGAGIKTDLEDSSPAIKPVAAPIIVVPESEMTSPAESLDRQKELSRQKTTQTAPAEKAVGTALSITPPETKLPVSEEKSDGTITSKKTSSGNPWAIPNADYPLRYY